VGVVQSHLRVRTADSGLLDLVIDSSKGSRHTYMYEVAGNPWQLSIFLPLNTQFRFDFDAEPMLSFTATSTGAFAALRSSSVAQRILVPSG